MSAKVISIASRRRKKAKPKTVARSSKNLHASPKTRARRSPARSRLKPFTLPHFIAWSRELVLEDLSKWQLEQFQADFIGDLFQGRKENWFVLAEGNGKTTLIAGLALYHAEFKLQGFVPIAASSRDQALIMYGQAEGFVLRTPRLSKIFQCLEGYRRIRNRKMRSRIQVYAADAKTGDGIIPTLCIVEELHRHKDLNLYRTWYGKLDKRAGQIVAISTAGEPYSDFEDTRDKIRAEGEDVTRTETFVRSASPDIVMHDWSLPQKGDVHDFTLVKRANPFSGITVDKLKKKYGTPTMNDNHWRRFTCNLPTRGIKSAIADSEWDSARSHEEIPKGQPVDLGLDVGWKWDTTAMVPLWARDRDFRLLGPAVILTPPRDGNSLSPKTVHQAILEIHQRNPLRSVVMDISRAEETAEWIRDEIGCEVVEWAQDNPNEVLQYEKWMTGIRTNWLKHSGDRGLTRHVMNAVVRLLANGKSRFDRASTVRQRGDQDARVIDALTAASMVNAKVAERFVEEADEEPQIAWA